MPPAKARAATVFAILVVGGTTASGATTCTVPGTHESIQAAVDEASCDPIQLAEDDFPESVLVGRSVSIQGPVGGWATLWGRLEANGAGTVVSVEGLEIVSGCSGAAFEARNGARVESSSLRATKSEQIACNVVGRIFEDDFESGDTSHWTSVSAGAVRQPKEEGR